MYNRILCYFAMYCLCNNVSFGFFTNEEGIVFINEEPEITSGTITQGEADSLSDENLCKLVKEKLDSIKSLLPLTFGQKSVGYRFNPSGEQSVDSCKLGFAKLIDQMNELRNISTSGEQKRLSSVAITESQGAQMWAVKALTWKD